MTKATVGLSVNGQVQRCSQPEVDKSKNYHLHITTYTAIYHHLPENKIPYSIVFENQVFRNCSQSSQDLTSHYASMLAGPVKHLPLQSL